MLKVLRLTEGGTTEIDGFAPGSWVHCGSPAESDLERLQEGGVPPEFLSHLLDLRERTRVVRRGEAVHVVIHLPYALDEPSKIPYATAPVSLILLPELLVSSEPRDMGLFEKLIPNAPPKLGDSEKTRFVLNVLLLAASEYLSYLQAINLAVDDAEDHLQRSLRNREVLQLLNYQKSLVFFSTALNSIEVMIEKLRKGEFLSWSPAEMELAEDVLIEIRQAMYQVDIAQDILTQMMDAFASIVSNNLNTVMKFLAAVTIVISVPMLIASIYGMNVPLPGSSNPQSFGLLIVLSVVLSALVIVLLRSRDWL
jgi:magnesium transporter